MILQLKQRGMRGLGCDDTGYCDTSVQDWVNSLPNVTPDSGGGNFDWTSIFVPITSAAGRVITAQYGQPNIPPGTVLISGPNGQQFIRYQNGQQVPYVPSSVNARVSTGGGFSGLATAAIVGVVAVLALKAIK